MGVRVEGALYGGGFATEGGGLQPFVLPGELIELGEGGLVEVLERSSSRTEPRCVHFGSCGGCQYQHAGYEEQLALKAGIWRGLVEGAGLGLPEPKVLAGEPWGYRNRVRLRVQAGNDGVVLGYSRRGSNDFLAVRMCPIAAPVLWRMAEALMWLGSEDALCRRWLETVLEVELFCSGDEAKVQMQVFLRNSDVARQKGQGLAAFCERVKASVPELVGAGALLDPELGRRARRAWDGAAWGAEGLSYEAAGRTYWVSRGAFFQVNRFLVDRLVKLVTDGRGGRLAWDLYAGVGLFSRALAERFSQVVAVEGGEAAAADLARAARTKGSAGFEALRAPIVEFLAKGVLQRERPELVVLDPPRAGLGVEGCGLLSRIGPAEVVYVSCDPTTLVRDLTAMVAGGYDVQQVKLIDLFPQTFHLETVVTLRRA